MWKDWQGFLSGFARIDPSGGQLETADLAARVFELSQTLRQQWLTDDYAAKRRILEIVFLNCRLDGATLVPERRKPFDILTEGFVSEKSRGNKTAIELFGHVIASWDQHTQALLIAA